MFRYVVKIDSPVALVLFPAADPSTVRDGGATDDSDVKRALETRTDVLVVKDVATTDAKSVITTLETESFTDKLGSNVPKTDFPR
jgi:hypothetical protein